VTGDAGAVAAQDILLLTGRVALITGGTGDIGYAIAELYLRLGARVYISARSQEKGRDSTAELAQHGDCRFLVGDVSTIAGVRQLAAAYGQVEKGLDILVHNAGGSRYAPLDEFSEEDWDTVFDLNLKGIFFLTQALMPMLRKSTTASRPSTVITIGSAAGIQASANEAYSYSASKAALHYLTRKLARRLASEHITVNSVCPGPVEAGLMLSRDEAFRKRVTDEVPLGRMARPEEVAHAAAFLASPAGAFLTAVILPVDGGLTGCMR